MFARVPGALELTDASRESVYKLLLHVLRKCLAGHLRVDESAEGAMEIHYGGGERGNKVPPQSAMLPHPAANLPAL